MNLVMASVLLLAMLAFQPTLIYGSKNLASSAPTNSHGDGNSNSNPVNTARKIKSSKYGKRHSSEASQPLYSPALSASSKLVLSMESGDVLVRAARGAAVDKQNPTPVVASNGGKRTKSGSNKKQNKIPSTRENGSSSAAAAAGLGAAAGATSTTSANGGRKHLEKKFSATSGLSTAQQSSSGSSNGNGKGKQRQMLKSQNHQGKRSGNGNGSNKAIRDDGEMLPGESEKTSACRYAKSVWSECDAKTNTRSRTLSLKKGDASCQQTRTMEKKCKKSCRYEKGAWSECINGQMTREDKLKATGGGSESSSCEPMRSINKKCNPNNGGGGGAAGKQANGGSKKERKNKDKGSRRNQAQQQQQQQQP